MTTKARDIAYQLTEQGIPVLSISEPEKAVDGIIHITPTLQVQVSVLDDFLNVVKVTQDDMLDFGEVTEDLGEIVAELATYLNAEKVFAPV